jgi:hypothetical protein
VSSRFDRSAGTSHEHVVEVRIEARLDQQDGGNVLSPGFDRTLFDDCEAVARKADRRMVGVRQKDHVMDPECRQYLRTSSITSHRITTFDRLAGAKIDRPRK